MWDFILKYWLECLFSLAFAGFSFGFKYLQKKVKENELLKEGLIAILHDRLYQSGMYFLEHGEIKTSQLNNLEKLYEAYHKLGGNGTGTEIFERVRELPLKN